MLRRRHPAWLSLVFLVELAFLGHRPLARDEVVSVEAAHRTFGALWDALGQIDAAVGAYYLLLHPVVAISDTAYAARLPSLLGVVAACAILVHAATAKWGRRTGFMVALVLLGNPVTWEFANIVRPYALALALAAATLHLVLIEQRRAVLLGALGVVMLYLQSMFVLLLLAEAVVLWRRQQWALLRGIAVAVVLWLPLLAVVATQTEENAWIPLSSPLAIAEQAHEVFGSDGPLSAAALLVWGAALVLAARRSDSRRLMLFAGAPVLLLIVLGLRLHLLGVRYVLWSVLVLALAAGLALAREANDRVVTALCTALVLLGGAAAVKEATITYRLEDMPAMASYLAAHDQPGDAVLFAPDWTRTPVIRSLSTTNGVELDDIALKHTGDRRDAGYIYLPEHDRATIERELVSRDRVWVVGYPDQTWNPVANTSAEIAAQLKRQWHTSLVAHFGQLEVRLLVRQP